MLIGYFYFYSISFPPIGPATSTPTTCSVSLIGWAVVVEPHSAKFRGGGQFWEIVIVRLPIVRRAVAGGTAAAVTVVGHVHVVLCTISAERYFNFKGLFTPEVIYNVGF